MPHARETVPNARAAWPGALALAVLAAWALLYALAPPERNVFWAVNGLRSVSPALAMTVALAAISSIFVPRLERNAGAIAIALGGAIALVVAGPLRQGFRLLGDTATRWAGIGTYVTRAEPQTLREWAVTFHAQPLDLLTGFLLPAWITRATGSRELGIGVMGVALALLYFAGAWRVSRGLADRGQERAALWLALVAWGGLEGFAGYAESTGVLLAAAAWWWAAMLSPLRRGLDAATLVLAWLVLFASHRLGLVMLAPLALRLLGSPLPGDEPRVRRAALLASAIAGAAALAFQMRFAGGRLGSDVGELLHWPAADALATVPTDLLNLALLVAPLALLAALLCGREAWGAATRDPRAGVLLAAAVVLLPTAFPMPVAGSGLGLPRDWDLAALLGLTLTILGVLVFAHTSAPRRRVALQLALPLLVLGAGGWLAVNASETASEKRAYALLADSPPLGEKQASAVELLLGDHLVGLGRMAEAAQLLESSWRRVPSPARGLHAARAWLYAGDPAAALRMVSAVRERGELPPRRALEADTLEIYARMLAARQAATR